MRTGLGVVLALTLIGGCVEITGLSALNEVACSPECEGGTAAPPGDAQADGRLDARPDARPDALSDAFSDAVSDAPDLGRESATAPTIENVFFIAMTHQPWPAVKGSASAPYINGTLLPMGSHAESCYAPAGLTIGESNWLFFEAGQDFGVANDDPPSINSQSTTAHLVTLLNDSGISWKAYLESAPAGVCPIVDAPPYAVEHAPMLFFDDVTNGSDAASQYCQAHVFPYTAFASDLASGKLGRYNYISPNECDDMYLECTDGGPGALGSGDEWLAAHLPAILGAPVFAKSVVIIAWDFDNSGAGDPIGLIVLSPFAKAGYQNSIVYSHDSVLWTIEEIFGVTPLLGDGGGAVDLSDMFTSAL